MEKKQEIFLKGALWITILSLIAIPCNLYLNWILGFFDANGETLGRYVLIIIFFNTITTFVLCGGSNLITNFLPKIEGSNKGKFLFTYLLLCIVLLIITDFCFFYIDDFSEFIFGDNLSTKDKLVLIILSPLIVFSQIIIFELQGKMHFSKAAIFKNFQIILMSIIVTLLYFFGKEYVSENSLFSFSISLLLIYVLIILFGLRKNTFVIGIYYNKRILNFIKYSFGNTINSYLFMNFDKILIAKYIGLKELGIYYVLINLSSLIKFLSVKIGQVLLSSFSNFVHQENVFLLKKTYTQVCELLIFISTTLSILLMCSVIFLSDVFGVRYDKISSLMLMILVLAGNFANTGSINSMLILAKEQNKYFYVSNTILIVSQILFTIIFISKYEIWAVLFGRVLGIFVGQIGLFVILNKMKVVTIAKDYYKSQVILLISSAIGFSYYYFTFSTYLYILLQGICFIYYVKISDVNPRKYFSKIKSLV